MLQGLCTGHGSYVRDTSVYEGVARYNIRILPGAFHNSQDASSFSYSIHYLNLSEECSINSKHIASLRLVRTNQQFKSNV